MNHDFYSLSPGTVSRTLGGIEMTYMGGGYWEFLGGGDFPHPDGPISGRPAGHSGWSYDQNGTFIWPIDQGTAAHLQLVWPLTELDRISTTEPPPGGCWGHHQWIETGMRVSWCSRCGEKARWSSAGWVSEHK